jgi:hypothetical protein
MHDEESESLERGMVWETEGGEGRKGEERGRTMCRERSDRR